MKGRSTCITFGDPPAPGSARARAMTKALTDAGSSYSIVPWCAGDGARYTADGDTRTDACLNGMSPLLVVFTVGTQVIGTATFAMFQEIHLLNNAPEIDQNLVLVPMEISPTLGAVTLNWATFEDCDDCTQSPKVSEGEMTWAGPEDVHPASQHFTTIWNGTGKEEVNLGWTLRGTIAAVPGLVESLSLGNTYGDLAIRCDDLTKGNSSAGCVFKNYTPTYTVSTDRYPAAGAYYWLMKTHNSNHFGSKADHSPLHYSADGQTDNRAVVCPTSWTGRTETPDASCDEYAFATTKESGGARGSGVTSGDQCAQYYATPIDSTTWTLRDDDRYDIPNWSEKCGRASIPLDQNTGALAPFGRTGGFVWYNRMLDEDAFWVATPGFDHCTAADTTCVMRTNAT